MFLRRNHPVEVLVLTAMFLVPPLRSKEVFAQDSQSKDADRISGVVVNSVTHEPIAGALVAGDGERFAALTDHNGRFEFTFAQTPADKGSAAGSSVVGSAGTANRSYGPQVLQARKPGFLDDQNDPALISSSIPGGKDVTISLVPEARIVVHVALPTSEPPDPIEVEIYKRQVRNGRAHWVSAGVQASRSNGESRFSELSAGTYKLLTHELMDRDPQASAPGGQAYGYAPVYFPDANGFASAGTIELTAGKTVHVNLSLVKQAYYPVKVPVVNAPPGVPLSIKVSVQGRDGPGYALGYIRREQAIEGLLPNGSYRLEAVSYRPSVVSGAANITVRGPVEGPTLTVVAGATIDVHVKEEFASRGRPGEMWTSGPRGSFRVQGVRSDVNLMIEPVDDFGRQIPISLLPPSGPQDDSLVMQSVPLGRYWVQIMPNRGYASSVTSGGVDLLHKPLAVPASGSVDPIEIILRDDSAELEGIVEDPNIPSGTLNASTTEPSSQNTTSAHTPKGHVYCIPLPDSSGRFTQWQVYEDGKLSMVSLPPGAYRLLAFRLPQSDLEYENPEAMRAFDGKGQVVRLVAGQKERVQLQFISTSE